MKIVKITKKEIYCYHDYSFMIFNRQNIILGAEIIGCCWAAGKARIPNEAGVDCIKKDTVYHQILVTVLMDLVIDEE